MTPRRWTIRSEKVARGEEFSGRLIVEVQGPDTDTVEVLAVEDAVDALARALYDNQRRRDRLGHMWRGFDAQSAKDKNAWHHIARHALLIHEVREVT